MVKNSITPPHPGETLYEDFMEPLGISQSRLARELGVDPRRINEIVNGKRSITVDTALRLEKYFGASAMFWINLQTSYDLRMANRDGVLSQKISKIIPVQSGN
ncbi:MAG: HigA family addiction module antitoxin [Anaerolineae bacterium]|nr:HigA family addiction module antitoxin [Anaerolineae bacterium]